MASIRELNLAEMGQVEGGMWVAICFVGGFIFVKAAFPTDRRGPPPATAVFRRGGFTTCASGHPGNR
jgi:hypothetical protein